MQFFLKLLIRTIEAARLELERAAVKQVEMGEMLEIKEARSHLYEAEQILRSASHHLL